MWYFFPSSAIHCITLCSGQESLMKFYFLKFLFKFTKEKKRKVNNVMFQDQCISTSLHTPDVRSAQLLVCVSPRTIKKMHTDLIIPLLSQCGN